MPSASCKMRPRSLAMVTDAAEQAARRRGARARRWRSASPSARSSVEPDLAALDLVGVGPLVQAPLAAHLVLEVLHRVGDEDLRARDIPHRPAPGRAPVRPGRRTACRRGPPCRRAARRPASDRACRAPFARHRLRRVLVERAARARSRLWPARQRVDCGATSSSSGLVLHRATPARCQLATNAPAPVAVQRGTACSPDT